MIVGGPLGRQLGTEEDGDRDKTINVFGYICIIWFLVSQDALEVMKMMHMMNMMKIMKME